MIAHPEPVTVKLMGGQVSAEIPKWTMARRAQIKPKIARLFQRAVSTDPENRISSVSDLFTVAEDELVEICRVCVILPEGVKFDDLLWEDLPIMVQAIWDHNVITEGGGGLAGKLAHLVQPMLAAALRQALVEKAKANAANPNQSPSPQTKPSEQRLQV